MDAALLEDDAEDAAAGLRDWPATLVRAAVAMGIVARVVQYLWRRSYWHDEAYLVLNVASLSYRQFVGPLPHAQSAPPLFLVAQKALFDAMGQSEYVLRLLPLVLGCAAIVLMAVLARRTLGPLAATVAVALLALSDRLIGHAAEAKQYSGDALFALLLLLVATRPCTSDARRLLAAALVAAATLWFSHPVVFVFGGIALALLPALLRRGPRGAATFALCAAPAAASFAVLYALSIRHQEVAQLYAYWGDRFPDWSRPWVIPAWLVHHLLGLGNYAFHPGGGALVIPLAAAGAWAMWRDVGRRQLLGMLLAPLGLTVLASCLHRYPFGGTRVTLFLVPPLLLLAGAGVAWLWDRVADTKWRGVGIAVPVVLIVFGVGQVALRLVVPRHRGHIRPAVEFVQGQRQGDEPVYMIGDPAPFLCYWREPGLPLETTAAHAPAISDERFWVVVAIATGSQEREVESAMMRTADRIGPPRRTIAYRGGAAYQFVRVGRATTATTTTTATRADAPALPVGARLVSPAAAD